jgi:hypothetical protein
MMTKRRARLVTTCGLALCLSAVGRATTFVPTDFADLVTEAAAIVHGRVTAARADWADGRAHVDTFVVLEVEEYLKGNLGASFEIRVPGGELGRYRDIVIGAPRLAIGDDVILFVSTKGGTAHVLGMMLGVFRVRHDGGQAEVRPAPALARDGEARKIVRGSRQQAAVSIASFAAQVNEILATPRVRKRP